MGKYDDIIHLSRPISTRHAPMSMIDRGAQFSPFAALTGYDAAISETARLTDQPMELDESQKLVLGRKIRILQQEEKRQPRVRLTWFCPDERKSGGAYLTVTAAVRRVDPYEKAIFLTDGQAILFSSIAALEGLDIDLEEAYEEWPVSF